VALPSVRGVRAAVERGAGERVLEEREAMALG
jgi:hypothetical protein